MKYNYLGRTGVEVSELCFGTMSFGGDADRVESAKMYAACRDSGINFFDCANTYSSGLAEEILGDLIKAERNELIITTKSFNQVAKYKNTGGNNRRTIVKSVEDSLKRLGTDRIDIHFLHQWDETTPLEESLRALEFLIESGKIIYLGASNFAAWQIAKGLGISERLGWSRFDVLQPMYSLVKRQAETEILPLAQAEKIGVITYSPVGGGLLSGKYGPNKRPNEGRILSNPMYTQRYHADWLFDTAGSFSMMADNKGIHPVSLAVAWAGAHPGVTSPIIGARSKEQLTPSLDSVNIDMTRELYQEISALSPTPAPATDRSENLFK
jgi:aryl-alcohol dehydrogenase-like predicted oxidoreductase